MNKDYVEVAEGIYYEVNTGLPWSSRTRSDPHGADLHRIYGTVNGMYYKVKVDRKDVLFHHLVWDFFFGGRIKNTHMVVDHRDGNTLNNLITNLQYVSQTVNAQKKTLMRSNVLGIQGVKKQGGKYRARIVINAKLTSIGSYNTIEEAHNAYLAAKIKYHGAESVLLIN